MIIILISPIVSLAMLNQQSCYGSQRGNYKSLQYFVSANLCHKSSRRHLYEGIEVVCILELYESNLYIF